MIAFHDKPVLLGAAVIAYAFGLRDAVDTVPVRGECLCVRVPATAGAFGSTESPGVIQLEDCLPGCSVARALESGGK